MRLFFIILFFSLSFPNIFAQSLSVFINEINYAASNPVEKGFEVAGQAGAVLDDYSIANYHSDGTLDQVKVLSGSLPSQQNGHGVGWFEVDQSSDGGGVALLNPTGTVLQFLSYGNAVLLTATDGPAEGLNAEYVGIQLLPIKPLQLTGTGLSYFDFLWTNVQSATPTSVNEKSGVWYKFAGIFFE